MTETKIILYHQDSCGQCKMVEMLLKKKNIQFESNKDINQMMELGIKHTPTLSVNGQLLVGKELINWINER